MAPDGIVVRGIALGDIAAYAACVAGVINERQWLAHLEPFRLEDSAHFVASNLRNGNPHFVADDGGRIVGWCDIVRSAVSVRRHCGTLGIGVQADRRDRGLGLRLVTAALAAARGAGFERVDLVVYARNARAAALYRKAGFRDVGRRTRAKKIAAEYDDELLMELLFEQGPT